MHISDNGKLTGVEHSIPLGMEFMRMQPGGKFLLTPAVVFVLGFEMERLEWALATVTNPIQLAVFIGTLRVLEQFTGLEDIGKEASYWYNFVASQTLPEVEANVVAQLRASRTKWETIIRERLGDLYLVTPQSALEPKKLMAGVLALLPLSELAVLFPIEISDLHDACRCILIGSYTPAEFSALRAAESLLRRWYEAKTAKRIERQPWGYVLDHLVKEYPEAKRPKEISLLGYLKIRRDEVAHPERVSSPVDAEATLLNVCSLVVGLKSELSKLPFNLTLPQLPASQSGPGSSAP